MTSPYDSVNEYLVVHRRVIIYKITFTFAHNMLALEVATKLRKVRERQDFPLTSRYSNWMLSLTLSSLSFHLL